MRRLISAVVVAAMMVLPGCGRQVTGLDLPSGAVVPIGQTLIRFETAGPLDFQNVTYLIVLNTSGNDLQPYSQGFNTDFKNWSAYFIVGGGAGFANAPGLVQIYQNPANNASSPFTQVIPVGTLTFQTTVPNGISQFGFQIQFNNCLVDFAPPTANTPTPPSVNRTCPPYQNIATLWNLSLFTLDRTLTPVDSLGVNGPSDTSYKHDFDTAVTQTLNFVKPASGSTTQNPSAQIVGFEVFTTAQPGAVPAPSPTPTTGP